MEHSQVIHSLRPENYSIPLIYTTCAMFWGFSGRELAFSVKVPPSKMLMKFIQPIPSGKYLIFIAFRWKGTSPDVFLRYAQQT